MQHVSCVHLSLELFSELFILEGIGHNNDVCGCVAALKKLSPEQPMSPAKMCTIVCAVYQFLPFQQGAHLWAGLLQVCWRDWGEESGSLRSRFAASSASSGNSWVCLCNLHFWPMLVAITLTRATEVVDSISENLGFQIL